MKAGKSSALEATLPIYSTTPSNARRFADTASRFNLQLAEWYGPERARKVKYAEAFEVGEYGRVPTKEEIRKLFPFYPPR